MVHFQQIALSNGLFLGEILLASARLNAQSLAMVLKIREQIESWRHDEKVVAVLVRGEGERAFCAGGDIRALYHAMSDAAFVYEGDDFFRHEYDLCRELHRFPKPVLAWGNGIVMGGGWGIFAAASHRIVTESSILAMPEISIGLFPDVGASFWLQQLEGKIGCLLALTGSRLNAADALAFGAAEFALPAATFDSLIGVLQDLPWSGQGKQDAELASGALSALSAAWPCSLPTSVWLPLADEVERICAGDDLLAICERIQAYQGDAPALRLAAELQAAGSPTSIFLTWEMARRAQTLSYDEVVEMEWLGARNCLRHGDFHEGVRAKLIDRDDQPNWSPKKLSQVKLADIESFFNAA
ncbi:enoyl-CoA hydratase/isomerase family protein [Iodobacter sp.]|uniref:enoyl-CoA hydratase/isomerase family protein n=1 Tax=Iodobacter sp. TaxID=1915058 RepID=UPI0025D2EA3E|nr:enoyl-CoA hydratase/isomerase family protein [Iodobacter sp.]